MSTSASINMSTEQLTVKGGKGSAGKKVTLILIFFVLVLVLSIIFLALYVTSNKENDKLESKIGKLERQIDELENGSGGVNKTTPVPTTIPTTPTPGNKIYHNIRLPQHIKPINYDIDLKVNMGTKDVEGSTTIKTNVSKECEYIMVHQMGYRSLTGSVQDSNGKKFGASTFEYDPNQYIVIKANTKFTTGIYYLKFEFSYDLRKDLAGFYLSKYTTKSGEERLVAATQFEPVDARSAFPCFDEPSMKATFDIKLTHHNSYIALSNMPVMKNEADKNITYNKNTYKTSPIMSTYLVVFVICDFEKKTVTANTTEPTNMTYYAPADQIGQIDYAMKVGSEILPVFEKYYNVPYPLEKADMIAIPDFAAGAMENWGLITYRARALLYKERESSISNKLYVASVISHELAHQWFGNIVTMDWWSDLWLNEGFASYVEYIGVDNVHPDWNITDFQVITDVARAMNLDSLVSSHPIYIEVQKPADIDEIFDGISYAKGGSILRMLDNFLGEDVFKSGLNVYLKQFSYRNAKTKDLWESLSEASKAKGDGYNVTDVMNSWIFQMNFPEIRITGNSTFKVDQIRFLSDKNPDYSKDKFNSTYGYKWHIPFKYTLLSLADNKVTVVNESTLVWMKYNNVTVNTNSKDLVIKGNAGQYGFYRVNYDANGWKNMQHVLKTNHMVLAATDRAGLVGDAFAFAKAGRLSYATALDVFDYIDSDADYLPWKAASDGINYIPGVLTKTRPAQKKMNKYMLSKVSAKFEQHGFKDVDGFRDRFLQVLIASLACGNGHVECRQNATDLFNKWMKDNSTVIPGDFRSMVYYYGIQSSGVETWDKLFKTFRNNKIASEKNKLLYGLAAIQEPWALERYLHYALNESMIRSQDTSYVFSYVANNNPIGRNIAWNFLKENWDLIYNKYKNSFFTLRRIFSGVTAGFTTQYELDQMKRFMDEKKPANGVRIIQQSEEQIKATIRWLNDNEQPIDAWLTDKVQSL